MTKTNRKKNPLPALKFAIVPAAVLALAGAFSPGCFGPESGHVLVQTDLDGRAHLEATSRSVSVKSLPAGSGASETKFTGLVFRVLSGSAAADSDSTHPQGVKRTLNVESPVPAPFLSVNAVQELDTNLEKGDRWEVSVTCGNGDILHASGVLRP